ncbi:EAL domain-containing protein [Leuconostoc falkenbergense]|uniref:EAL domain-containing protein n=1 Tax=Leuconostoc falkenbergense TaxID=2766470 RepID=UPI0024AE6D92|nr:EAL domain-containing protein [Leuconostoc falkenbergense]MDI6666849.1 EAL domain-containing protein [Leuconostoc falkenbergense]
MNTIITDAIKNFYFVGQPIRHLKNEQIIEFELLLRNNIVSGFPKDEYAWMTKSETIHAKFLKHIVQEVNRILVDNPEIHFSLNLDQQEIEYETTFEIMKNISQENRSRLILEITEIPTLRRYGQYGETINVLAFKRLKKLGYRLALDDLTTGNNSLGNLEITIQYLDRLKISYRHLEKMMTPDEIVLQIHLLQSIVGRHDMDLVVEGVETESVSDNLQTLGVSLQQGFLFKTNACPTDCKKHVERNKRNQNDDHFRNF